MSINRPATNRGRAWGKGSLRRSGRWKGEGRSRGALWRLELNLGPELERVVSGVERGGGKFKPPLGRNWGPEKRRNNQIGLGTGRGGAGPRRPPEGAEAARCRDCRSQLPVPTAGGLQLPSFLDFLALPPASECVSPAASLSVSVAVFLHFSWFVSMSAVSLLPCLPGLNHFPGLPGVRDVSA